jgi:hypothetical protein
VKIRGVVGKHVGSRQQLDWARYIATLDSPRIQSHMAFAPIRHGRRHLRALIAPGEGSCEVRHDEFRRFGKTEMVRSSSQEWSLKKVSRILILGVRSCDRIRLAW